ncbi:hypothetical protein GCM10020331_048200 [Ectobacillus funiculus]
MQGIPVDKPIIGELVPNSAGEKAGLHQGDVIKSINGTGVDTWTNVTTIIRKKILGMK